MPDTDYINVDELTSPSFYYDGDDHIVVNNTKAYNPFSQILNLDKLSEEPTPEVLPDQYYIYVSSVENPTFQFGVGELLSFNANTNTDPIGGELCIDTLEFEVYYDDTNSTLQNLAYATPVYAYRNGDFVGKFYFKTIERYGVKHFKISCVSIIGLLEYETHYGGIYNSVNAKKAITEAIIGNGIRKGIGDRYPAVRTMPAQTVYSVPLAANATTGVADTSGTKNGISLTFTVYEADYSPDAPVWYLSSWVTINSTRYVYSLGVRAKKQNLLSDDDSIYLNIHCKLDENSSSYVARATAHFGEELTVNIIPWLGTATVYGSSDEETQEFEFTPITENAEVPLYSSLGVDKYNSLSYGSTTLDYEIREFSIYGNSSSTARTKYCNLEFYQDPDAANDYSGISFVNSVTGYTSNVTNGSYYVSGMMIPDYPTDSSELMEAAENIIWADGLDSMTISGWIPVGTKREVLHQILFALNLNLLKSETGDLIINKLPTEIQKTITQDETYDRGSVEKVTAPHYLELTEHTYTAPVSGTISAQDAVVFDNALTVGISGEYIAVFNNAPIYGTPTASSELTIVAYNENAAVLRGKGIIMAQSYTHSQRVIQEVVSDRPDGGTVSVTSATAVTFLNSETVMNKLLAYYASGAYKTKNDITVGGCMCGRNYTFAAPFGGTDSGYLIGARTVGSAKTKTECTFVSNYTPVDIGGTYKNYTVLTGSGTFTKPSGATKLYVVLIGGGTGGSSGFAGQNGNANTGFYSAIVARGGMYGSNGLYGNVYEVEINSPSASYSYSCGTGGAGGAVCTSNTTNNAGSAGTASTFGSYSSANGEAKPYTNIMNGDTYCGIMPMWSASSGRGGNGGYRTSTNPSNPTDATVTMYEAEDAYNFLTDTTYYGGDSYDGAELNNKYVWFGGCGGGGALGQRGGNGGSTETNAKGGNGGNATYIPPKATTYNSKYYGYGGMGGCGGGGGGCGGYNGQSITAFSGGTGGSGGKGGDGGDGCIIVYY